jgi:hypothetical protein
MCCGGRIGRQDTATMGNIVGFAAVASAYFTEI